jgi:hypothetical protein
MAGMWQFAHSALPLKGYSPVSSCGVAFVLVEAAQRGVWWKAARLCMCHPAR